MFLKIERGKQMSNKLDLFVGSYGTEAEETIYWLHFDPENESLVKVAATSGIENPSFVLVNNAKTHLYAVSEVDQGEVVSYKIDYDNHKLIELNRQPTKGGPCYIEIDENDTHIFTANYGGGSFIVHPLSENGEIKSNSDFVDYGSAAKEAGHISHAHAIKNIPGTKIYVATDLGLDKLYVYRFDEAAGRLEPITEMDTAKGAGPRHLTFREDLNRMYVLNQDDSTLSVYEYNRDGTRFDLLQTLPTLLEAFDGINYCADIHISNDFLYVSNRGHHSITGYKIERDGNLTTISNTPSQGDWPRGFITLPDVPYILVANEHTNEIIVMTILEDGQLKSTGNKIEIPKPVWLEVL